MAIIDSHNWANGDDYGWVNSPQGIVQPIQNVKVFGQFEVPGQWDKVGHYREQAIAAAPGLVFEQRMLVTKDTYTDVCFGIQQNPSFSIFGCAGVYFSAYQTGALQAFLWDVNTNNTSPMRLAIEANKFYTVRLKILPDLRVAAFLKDSPLGETVNFGSAPYSSLYGMLAFGQCGNGTGVAQIDNYKVRS